MHGASRADPDLEHLMKTSRDEDDMKADDGSGLWDQQELSALRTCSATSALRAERARGSSVGCR